MICLENVELFCNEDISMIENYDKAMADTTRTWHCHHKLETHNSDGDKRSTQLTRNELIKLGMYYNRPATELIFLTREEHLSIHMKGYKKSKESIEKMSKTKKRQVEEETYVSPTLGRHLTDEQKLHLRKCHKGLSYGIWISNGIEEKYLSNEEDIPDGWRKGRLKLSERQWAEERKEEYLNEIRNNFTESNRRKRGTRKWYNNGEKEILLRYGADIPDGFVLGRLGSSVRGFDEWNAQPHGNLDIHKYWKIWRDGIDA